ncbi:4535_t:CDS:2 [Entrophospora sp. SA101]|nr:4535_t:CDS:2 [Entrophospora sp. SA101]
MLEDCECVECCNKSIDTKKFFETIQRTKKNKFEITLIDKPMKHGDINGTKDFPTSIFLDKSICIIQYDSYSKEMNQSVSQLQFILSRNEIEKQMMIFLDICYEWYEPYLARIKKINEQQNELFETGYSLESKKFVKSALVKLTLGSDFGVFAIIVGKGKFSVAVVGAELIYDSNGYSIHFVDEDDENIASCVDDLYYKDIVKQAETIGVLTDPIVSPLENAVKETFKTLFPSLSNNIDDFLKNNMSPLSSRLPLMDPFHVILIVIGYFVVVFGGKAIMSSREKMSVKGLSILHNLFLVSLSAYMCITILSEAWKQGYSLFTNPEVRSEEGWQMSKYIWLFYFSKIFEFMDTFIMILKKNDRQITFLHVYHHFSIFMIWWLVVFIAPNGEAYFSAALNSAVHVVMYAYYLSTTLSFPIRFIKRYITLFQMTQFTLMMTQATYDIVYFKVLRRDIVNDYPFLPTAILWVYMWTMLGLFANFFRADRKREVEAKRAAISGKKVQ